MRYNAIISEAINDRASCQSGKTSKVAWQFARSSASSTELPLYLAFNYQVILEDAISKINQFSNNFGKQLNLINTKKGRVVDSQRVGLPRLEDILSSTGKLEQDRNWDYGPTGLIGLSNHYSLKRYYFCLGMVKNSSIKTPCWIDEGDPFELGFQKHVEHKSSRTGVFGASATNRTLSEMIKQDLFSEVNLVSATNIGIGISDIYFTKVEIITPGSTYTNKHEYFIVDETDIKSLEEGKITPRIKEFMDLIDNNLMINICQTIECHEAIGKAFKNNEEWNFYEVNMHNHLNVEELKKGKNVIAGGRMFGRGATFPRVEGLIFDKPTSHSTNLIQAVGRAHGYDKSYTPIIACTEAQKNKLEAAYEFEAQVSSIDTMELPPERRHNKIMQIKVPNTGLIILPQKNNGWRQVNRKTGSSITK